MTKERPKVSVAVIIKKDNKILLGKRKGSHGSGSWCFPGGHLEFFESLKECSKRETKEETRMEISNINFLTITNDFFREEKKHHITIFMTAKAEGELEVKEPEKCEERGYFNIDNLPNPLFKPIENLIKNEPKSLNKINNKYDSRR